MKAYFLDTNININYAGIFDKFSKQDFIRFLELKPSMIPSTPGVYAIFYHSHDKVTCLFVGRANNLKRRIYDNHLHGNAMTGRVKKYLIDDGIVEDLDSAKVFLKQFCSVKYISMPESDHTLRGKLESYLTYILDSYYIQKEH